MRFALPIAAALLQCATFVTSTPPFALLGLGYPPPTDLTSNGSLVLAAWSNFTAQVESYIRSNTTIEGLVPDLGSYTFSINSFSIHDPQAVKALQYHHTGADVRNSTTGDTRVNDESVYRVASITKMITVYLTLVTIGSEYWDKPITDCIPELAAFADRIPADPINVVDWKSVTLGTLAGQIAGIPRDTSLFGSDLALFGDRVITAPAFPPLNSSELSALDPCAIFVNASGVLCPRPQYFEALTKRPPILAPWTSPVYTNAGYALLSLAVEKITGKPFSTLMKEDLFSPLNMTSTYYNRVNDTTHAVIPGGLTSDAGQVFLTAATNDAASGGIFSSTADLAKLGLSILNSTLLSPLETRKWLKPIAHTNSLYFSLGRPWEIFRVSLPFTNRITDLYTKAGDATGYSSYFILSPDHGAGFNILIAGNASTVIARAVVADLLTETLLPALEAQAAKETSHNFAGTYTSSSPTLNSSISLAVDPAHGAGLLVKSWISNGTSVFPFVAGYGDQLSLFPTDLRTEGQVAFRATYGTTAFSDEVGMFARGVTAESQWEFVDTAIYGGAGVDWFVFEVDEKGRAVTIRSPATKVSLKRVD